MLAGSMGREKGRRSGRPGWSTTVVDLRSPALCTGLRPRLSTRQHQTVTTPKMATTLGEKPCTAFGIWCHLLGLSIQVHIQATPTPLSQWPAHSPLTRP